MWRTPGEKGVGWVKRERCRGFRGFWILFERTAVLSEMMDQQYKKQRALAMKNLQDAAESW